MKYIITIIILVTVLILFYVIFSFGRKNIPRDEQISTVEISGQRIFVELADTPAKRAQGLSGRDPLSVDTGMLFIFDEPVRRGFWMKDMKFSIDIIWILNNTIVDIWQNAPIPINNNIPFYTPKSEANYVLEVNAEFVEENNVKIGDNVVIDIKELVR